MGFAIDPQRIPDGDAPTRPLAPTATLWTFKGWYTDAALTTPADFTDPLTADQILFARWDPTLAVTGGTINYGALWAGAVAVSLGALLLFGLGAAGLTDGHRLKYHRRRRQLGCLRRPAGRQQVHHLRHSVRVA
ncbi:MAG TPA: InlB B-repeat-containing protein [Galbitalea sp.]|nr:InlB B-repeat-containing protein [Galbitalea sp.]